MTATRPRLASTALRVAAVLSALAIASYLVVRTQRAADEATQPSSGNGPETANPISLPPGLSTSKSLVIEPAPASLPAFPESGLDPGLFSSKVLRIPSTGPVPDAAAPTPAQDPTSALKQNEKQ